MDRDFSFTARTVASINEVDGIAWDRLAGADNIFASHPFLSALEDSGSASAEAGWAPRHLLLEDNAGALAGAMPLYLKSHSMGEYVFDQGWAEAWEQAGGHYYPKLQSSVPFTPATGSRLLVRPDDSADNIRPLLADAAIQFAEKTGVSSLHVTFLPEDEWRLLGAVGFLPRIDRQFHWKNEGYATFDDFLGALSSRKRKTIRRERRRALEDGIEIDILRGTEIREEHWDAFFAFYQDTGARKWGRPYLSRAFFSLAGERLGDRVVLILSRRGGGYIAGALNFIGGDTLYGRYWGCTEDHPFLHFEVCYYRAIDFAIAHGLKRVEAGAQGAHKLARGYVPNPTYSAHWIADPGFRDAVARFLAEERRHITVESQVLGRFTPFRRADGDTID